VARLSEPLRECHASIGIAVLGALLYAPPAQAELLVNISKSQQRLSAVVDGAEAYRRPVSTGRRGYETPAGSFQPVRLERHWYSHKYDNASMPWSVFFYRGYAVHGTAEAYSLGHAASHGCVRLRSDNAATLFSLVRKRKASNVKFLFMNSPLPAAPGSAPMAQSEEVPATTPPERRFAEALAKVEAQHNLSAKAPPDIEAAKQPRPARVKNASLRAAPSPVHRMFVASDEARVLREREAWLRSLDRKYGIR
jgi:L,D-transpeptidase catalytic domain